MAACMKGFRKLDPPKGKGANTNFQCYAGVCEVMTQNMQYQMALWLMTHLGSLCKARGDVEAGAQTRGWSHLGLCKKWIIVLNSGEHQGIQATSKVGESDEALEIDQEYLQWLGAGSDEVNTEQRSVQQSCFPFQMSAATQEFQKAVKFLQYDQHSVACVYQIRHGAASTDVLQKLRTLEQVQKTGKMGNHEFREKVLKRRSNQSSVSGAIKEGSRKGNLSREADCKDFRSIPGASKSHESLMGLELFSGSGTHVTCLA